MVLRLNNSAFGTRELSQVQKVVAKVEPNHVRDAFLLALSEDPDSRLCEGEEARIGLGGHPKPAINGHLKTGN